MCSNSVNVDCDARVAIDQPGLTMCESSSDCELPMEKSDFRPSLKYLLTGWRLRRPLTSAPFSHSQERKLCKMVLTGWKSGNYLTTEQFQIAVFRFAKANSVKVHPRWEQFGQASNKWLVNFLRKHPDVKSMLIGQPGVQPKRKASTSDVAAQSESSSDEFSDDSTEPDDCFIDSEPDDCDR